jgi:hypothetical protein
MTMAEECGGKSQAESPTAPQAPNPTERRAVPRFTALDPRGWIGWWAQGDFHEAEARLLDIGEFGAAIEVDRLPPRDCPLFFSLGGPTTVESVDAEVVATQPGRVKKVLMRLAFSSRCPGRLLTAIIDGPKAAPPVDPEPRGFPGTCESRAFDRRTRRT